MIDEIDEAIRQLLSRELPIRNSEIDIAFDMPKREWSARLSRPTLNLYLYDVRENVKMRQMTTAWESSSNGGTATTRRAPVRMDLYYMITAWATQPDDEHRLLGRLMQMMFRFPTLPEELMPDTLRQLKDLGNNILGNFGLSLDNFQAVQDPQTGSYSISFNQNK